MSAILPIFLVSHVKHQILQCKGRIINGPGGGSGKIEKKKLTDLPARKITSKLPKEKKLTSRFARKKKNSSAGWPGKKTHREFSARAPPPPRTLVHRSNSLLEGLNMDQFGTCRDGFSILK